MELVSLYPYDPTARATSNKIVNESITVIPPSQITDYSYVVPRAAPFFAETLVVKDGKGVGARTLVENVDYWCVIDFLSASTALTKRVCVGIALLDPGYSGTLYVTYQAVGGNYTLADYSILEELIRERYVVKHVSYEQIINLPAGFAPEWHEHEIGDMVGMSQVVSSLDNIETALLGRQGSYGQLSALVNDHIGSTASHTSAQVGLGNVKNYDVATLTDAVNGAGNKYVLASIMKQYVNQRQVDVSGFMTTTAANAAFVNKSTLVSYSTSAQSDSRYALKGDTYTKLQIDAKINDIDVSSALTGYYTKLQSDAKYATVSDISGFIKETVADIRYVPKTTLASYYTKTETDSRYALKTASYTKSESDNRYLTSASISSYLTESEAAGIYQPKSEMSSYYTKSEINREDLGISFISAPTGNFSGDYVLRYTQRHANNVTSTDDVTIILPKHAKLTDVYTKTQVDKLFRDNVEYNTASERFTKRVVTKYRNYNLNIDWTLVRTGNIVYCTYVCKDSFYWNETESLKLTTGPSGAATAYSGTSIPDMLSFSQNAISDNPNVDYWFRLWTLPSINRSTGEITIQTTCNTAQGNSSTFYSSGGFQGSFVLHVSDKYIDDVMEGWFTRYGVIYVSKRFNL